jgi:hypothetical protein
VPKESKIMREIHKIREEFRHKTMGKDRQSILKLIKEGSKDVIQELDAVASDKKMGNVDSIPERIKRLFWDVDKEKIDIKDHRSFIIRRIMNFGNMDDMKWMLRVYTSDEIIEVVKKSRGLSRKSAYFWSTYFNIHKKEIECLKMPYQKNLKLF